MYLPNCRRCPLTLKLIGLVLNVSKSCKLCPLGQTQLVILVKISHVSSTCGRFCHFAFLETFVILIKKK
ncbi:hypothetical protein Hanom_Chr17g01571261 [Helianthus anomalus]